jgi:hypothetical protein
MKIPTLVGAAIWASTLALTITLARDDDHRKGWGRLWRYATHGGQRVELELPPGYELSDGERLYSRDSGRLELVGAVRARRQRPDGVEVALLRLDPEAAPVTSATAFRLIDARGDMSWALQTLLPEARRSALIAELRSFREAHRDEIFELSQLVARDLMAEAATLLEANLSASVARHEAAWRAVLERHRAAIKTDLLPLLKERLGPTVKARLKPLLTELGRELWDALPIWSVTWRSVVDRLPGVQQKFMDRWWNDFLENKAIPIVGAHEEDFVTLGEELTREAIDDPALRAGFARIARALIDDPAFRKLVQSILQESLIDPFDGDAFSRSLLANKALRSRFDDLARAFQPSLKRMTKLLVEDSEGRLNADLVEVVRRLFFERRGRALVAEGLGAPGAPTLSPTTRLRLTTLSPPATAPPSPPATSDRPATPATPQGDF